MYAYVCRRWLLVWALIFGLLLTGTPTANAQDVKPEPYNDYYEIVSYTETPTRIDAVVRINTGLLFPHAIPTTTMAATAVCASVGKPMNSTPCA